VAGREEIDRDVVLASVQTLSQPRWLERPELARFDYVVVDEFHHAAADSYARLLAVLQPRFLLGLTATPWRGDNRDLMALCHGNVAYEVGLFEAISYGWLVPFHYFGVADVVAYDSDMLTRAGTYDATRLTLAFNTPERAALALTRYRQHGPRAALGFCVSIAHAEFMARAFDDAGVPAAAVHSGPESVPRQQALEQLASGRLRVLFTVDLFNEGVDIPCVDLVMFLRPTESMVVFLQQLGRGLRLHEGKDFLTVLDFLGNYRRAHFKLPFLVGSQGEDTSSAGAALRLLQQAQASGTVPPGVPENVRIELEPLALAALKESLRSASPLRELVQADLKDLAATLKRMPTLVEVHRLGRYGPRQCMKALECRRWAEVAQRLELAPEQDRALDTAAGDFLQEIERTAMTKSFKMVVLLAMLQAHRFPHAIGMADLVAAFRRYFSEERHRLDINGTRVEGAATDDAVWRRYLLDNPINAWTGGNTGAPGRYFAFDEQRDELRYIGPRAADLEAFRAAVLERVTWRLEDYWDRPRPGRFVYAVLPQGSDALCVMFGNGGAREGLPFGWHPVHINGRFFYGKFVKVALNVVKEQPTDDSSMPNLLAAELRRLLGLAEGVKPNRSHRVRLVPLPAQDAWGIERA
jgi:hypothetical protein